MNQVKEKNFTLTCKAEYALAGEVLKRGQRVGVVNGMAYPVDYVIHDTATGYDHRVSYQGIVDPFHSFAIHEGQQIVVIHDPYI